MSQSRSQGRRAPTSAGSHPAVGRGGSPNSTSSSQHSQSIKDIENDIDALIQEVDRLGKEFIASTKEYNSSLSKARQVHKDARANIFTDYLAKMQDVSLNAKPEDMKKQAYEELEKAAQHKLDEIKERIDNQAKEIEAEGSDLTKRKAARAVMNRTKANAIRDNAEEIKKVADTPEGMHEIKRCRERLDAAYKKVEASVDNSYQQYLKKLGDLKEQHEKIKKKLDEKNIPEVPRDRAEATERVKKLHSRDPRDYTAEISKTSADDKRMNLLKK